MPSAMELNRFIHAAMGYMIRSCGRDGRFRYWMNLDPTVVMEPRYNILRHAGALYALGLFHEQSRSPEAAEALVRGSSFLSAQIAEVPGWPGVLAVWSWPEIEGDRRIWPCAKLGGTGLGLVAFSYAERVAPGSVPIDLLRGLGRFLLRMQRPDGGFASVYEPEANGPSSEWVSLYYPGEAALGLLELYHLDPDASWLEAATRALTFLARSRAGRVQVEPDHWALLATARWLSLTGVRPTTHDRTLILDHVAQVARSMMAERPAWPAGSPLEGCFVADGRTCPTATRLEGLVAALDCRAEGLDASVGAMRRQIELGLAFLVRVQVPDGPAAGGIPRAIGRVRPDGGAAVEAFNRRAGEVRIDYVQHAVSAFLAWRRSEMLSRRAAS